MGHICYQQEKKEPPTDRTTIYKKNSGEIEININNSKEEINNSNNNDKSTNNIDNQDRNAKKHISKSMNINHEPKGFDKIEK